MEFILAAVALAVWVVLFWLFGLPTLARRRVVLFVLGFFVPLFWIAGVLLPSRG